MTYGHVTYENVTYEPVLKLLERRRNLEARWAAQMEQQGDSAAAFKHRSNARCFAEAAELVKEKQR